MAILGFLQKKKIKTVSNNAAEPVINQPTVNNRTFGPTHKKKDTFILDILGGTCDPRLFSGCKNTPIAIVTVNGEKIQHGGFRELTQFPNPGAALMVNVFPEWKTIIDAKSGNTIIKYYDKSTNEPVLMLFPQNYVYFYKLNTAYAVDVTHENGEIICHFTDNAAIDEMFRLNHATRQDFFYQVQQRQVNIEMFRTKTRGNA